MGSSSLVTVKVIDTANINMAHRDAEKKQEESISSPNPTPESKLALRGMFRAASGRLNRYTA